MKSHGIIIDGITGAGKTHTLKALLNSSFIMEQWSPCDVFREKETFGEFMGELLENPQAPTEHKFRLLEKVIRTATARASQGRPYRFIMERVHYSYYALLPEWDLYEDFDERLARLNPHLYLLWIPDESLKARALFRNERNGWAQGFIDLYGSEEATFESLRTSQNRRREAILRSAIPHTVIDTSDMAWERYANQIISDMKHSAVCYGGFKAAESTA